MKHLSSLPALSLWCALLFGASALISNGAEPSRQMVVSIAPSWDSQNGKLQLFERKEKGWQAAGEPWPVLYGRNGLAWGRGIYGTEEPGLHKKEKDKKAPAGVFALGTIYTYDSALPVGADFRFHTVTERDAWVDDPASPDYNRFVSIKDAGRPPTWFEKQKMRHNDFAYRWLVEIRHNSDPPQAGEGSAIFFHIRRGVDRPSAGCTTMAETNLTRLICWLREADKPKYALLPKSEYLKKWKAWDLPSPTEARALLD